jgi:hypothetical protein
LITHLLRRLALRFCIVALIAPAGVAVFAMDGHQSARPVAADPAYGNLKFSPTTQIVLENYIFSVPVQLTTCTDVAQNTKGTATGATTTTLTDTTKSWTVNQWQNYAVIITQNSGSPQQRTITSNTSNTITVSGAWTSPIPAAGTKYEIVDLSGLATAGSTSTTLVDSTKSWTTNQWANTDVVLISGANSTQQRKVLSNTGNTLTIDQPWGNIQQFGSATAATATTLTDFGSGWATNMFAGMQLELTGPGGSQIRTITSNTADTLTVSSAWATVQSTATPTGGTSTTLVDTTKSWTPNAFVNKTVQITAGPIGAVTRTITANTANTLTISGVWPVSDAGGANSGTTNTITDLTKTWTNNQFAGFTIELTSGTGAGQSRTVASNTATVITVSSNWTTPPDNTTSYQVLRTPGAGTSYIVRDGPAEGSGYQVRQLAPPATGTGYQLLNLKCHAGGYGVTINYPSAKFTVITDAGIATATTTTTLTDTTKAWKVNQWAGTLLRITGGAGVPQARTVVSNTATQLTISPAWSTVPVMPTVNSVYQLGGMSDGGFVTSTGRTLSCPAPASYGTGTASLSCVTFQPLPQGPTGAGPIVNLTLKAGSHQGNVLQQFTLTNTEVLQVDGTVSPVDVFTGTRRVILCPDAAPVSPGPDGVINSGDQGVIAQAALVNATANPPSPLYSTKKDPNEDGVVNSGDQGIAASVFGKRCVQP